MSRTTLPPIAPQIDESEMRDASESTPRKRKKRQRPQNTESGQDSIRGSRSRSASRSRQSVHSDDDAAMETVPKQAELTSKRRLPKRVLNAQDNIPYESSGVDSPGRETRLKKKKRTVHESQEALVPGTNGEVVTERTTARQTPRKKKKKKKPVTSDTEGGVDPQFLGLAADLTELGDDVVMADTTEEVVETKWTTPVMRSEPVSKVFIEQRKGFKSADKSKLAKKRAEEQERAMEMPEEVTSDTTLQVALSTQRVLKKLTLFLQGLFAGMTLWHIVAVWTLCNHGYTGFLTYYYALAMPVQSVYYFLFAICTVAAFDRYDVGKLTRRFVVRSASCQTGTVACLFYFAGLILSVSITYIDDKMSLSQGEEEMWPSDQERDAELNMWLIINLLRGLCAMFGWMIISLQPTNDRLSYNLQKVDENIVDIASEDHNLDVVRSSGV